jgi:hypothetical protein
MTAEPSISSPLQLSTMASRDFSSLPPEMIREVFFSVSTSNANTLKRHYSQMLDQTKCRQGPGWLGRSCLARLHAPHHVGSLYDRLLHYVRHRVIDIATSKLWHRERILPGGRREIRSCSCGFASLATSNALIRMWCRYSKILDWACPRAGVFPGAIKLTLISRRSHIQGATVR